MFYQYDLYKDNLQRPKLKIVKKINDNGSKSIEDTVIILNKQFNMKSFLTEHAIIVSYNDLSEIIGIFIVSIGNNCSCNFYLREIAIFLSLTGAIHFAAFHNHPNNMMDVSIPDTVTAKVLSDLSNALGIDFLGSYIISEIGWKSTEDDDLVLNEYMEV